MPVRFFWTSVLTLSLYGLAGCGGSSGSTQTTPALPSISSFTANPAGIAAGASSNLTPVFANGTGVITPGNLAVGSGVPVSVTPAATTTYTLTVTPSSGSAVTQVVTVTVTPAASIASFAATPSAILLGGSASLTGVFTNGTGMVTPGNLAVTSGVAISVTPSATTTYTLTVTPATGSAVTQTATVTVNPPAPTALTATAGNQEVTLSWPAVAAATSYAAMRSTTSGGPYAVVGTTIGLAFVDTSVVNNTAYFYVVAAVDASGESGYSPQATTTPMAPPAPSTGLTATPGDGQVTLRWTPGAGAMSYQVGRSATSGGPYATVGTSATATFTDTGLADGIAYYYVVYSVNPVGTSAASAEAMAIPIAAPANLTAVASDKQVALFWSPSLGATSYTVQVATQSGGPAAVAGTTQVNRFLATGLSDGVTLYYQVTASNPTGASAPSVQVSATPAANSNPLPSADDPTKNYVGLGTWFLNDWDGSSAFVDVMKQARPWMDAAWANPATVDALGWPTEDASTVLMTTAPQIVNGTYKLVFNGQATVSLMWSGGTVTNQAYNFNTNTSTADVNIAYSLPSGSMGIVFTNTKRTGASAVGSGFTNARLYRPGYPTDGSLVFTAPFLTALGKVSAVRMMDWTGGGNNFVVNWADRATPLSATQAGLPAPPYTGPDGTVHTSTLGVALEYQIQLCNTLLADCYINIPPVASDEFVTNMALALAFGTDGANPYTSPQANPVYPPLNPTLHIYLEYANEVWNSNSNVFQVVQAICENLPSNHPLLTVEPNTPFNPYYIMWRYPAWRMATISQIFSSVFGPSAMMTRVRPLLLTQQGDGQATLDQALQWLDAYAPTLTPASTVPQLLYGGGGSAYYGVVNAQSAVPSQFFAVGNYPDPAIALNWAIDSMWTYNYGIKHVAYEGGPGLSFSDGDNDTLNADPRMTAMVEAYHNDWSSQGGDLVMYYTLRGPSNWEFTPDIANANSPKLAALEAIQTTPRAPVTLGAQLPGTLTASAESNLSIGSSNESGYTATIGGQSCRVGPSAVDSYIAYPAHAAAAFAGTLTVSGSANATTQLDVYVNGVEQGKVTLAAQSTQALETSTSLSVNIPAGLAVIRLETLEGAPAFCSLTVH